MQIIFFPELLQNMIRLLFKFYNKAIKMFQNNFPVFYNKKIYKILIDE